MRPAPTAAGDVLAAMRAATGTLHAEAERTGFVAALLAGRGTPARYALWLRNLWPACDALETALLALAPESPLQPLAQPAVFRADALRRDLAAIGGASWQTALPLLPAGAEYARHVERAAQGSGAGLVAHAYVRYLGDLNGGRILRRIASTTLGLDARALAFYAYEDDAQVLETRYRGALAAAGAAVGDDAAAAAAAADAFRLNIALSEAVLAAA